MSDGRRLSEGNVEPYSEWVLTMARRVLDGKVNIDRLFFQGLVTDTERTAVHAAAARLPFLPSAGRVGTHPRRGGIVGA